MGPRLDLPRSPPNAWSTMSKRSANLASVVSYPQGKHGPFYFNLLLEKSALWLRVLRRKRRNRAESDLRRDWPMESRLCLRRRVCGFVNWYKEH